MFSVVKICLKGWVSEMFTLESDGVGNMEVGLVDAEMLLCYVAMVIWKMHEYKIGCLLLKIVPTLISNLVCSNEL